MTQPPDPELDERFRRMDDRVQASGRTAVRYRYGHDPSQVAELWLPAGDGPFPVAAVLHGGFWRAAYGFEHVRALCVDLAEHGMAVWNIEYRRVGNGGGVPQTLDDVGAAFDLLGSVEAPIDLDRVVAVGHSAGGHLAMWCGGGGWVSGVVSLAGVLDTAAAAADGIGRGAVDEFCGGTPGERPAEHAAIELVGRLPLGVVVVHGTGDEDVPYQYAIRFVKACEDCANAYDLVTLEDVGHVDLIDPGAPVWPRVRTAILGALT